MFPSTSTNDKASEKAHPNEANDKMHDKNKRLTEHKETKSEINGKTNAQKHINIRRKSDANENTAIRRKSDAERHSYADAHTKDHHPGIDF
jgi:hypothetical protein